MRTNPRAEAVYEIVTVAAGGFDAQGSTSEASSATVSRFATPAAADAWVIDRKRRVESQSQPRTSFHIPAKNAAAGG